MRAPGNQPEASTRVLMMHLERDAERIAGAIVDEAGACRPFAGWLELATLLDAIHGTATTVGGTS